LPISRHIHSIRFTPKQVGLHGWRFAEQDDRRLGRFVKPVARIFGKGIRYPELIGGKRGKDPFVIDDNHGANESSDE
jgi:hypothetical protein